MSPATRSFTSLGSAAPARRRRLAGSALFTVAALAAVAWWGDQTHFHPLHRPVEKAPPVVPFQLDPDPPIPVEVTAAPVREQVEVAVPQLPDTPMPPLATDFTVPIEPPHPVTDMTRVKIPVGGANSGPGVHPFDLSQVDQGPIAKYQSSPFYPDRLKREGITGEVVVDFVVDPSGNVRNATAAHSSQREFEESACEAVSKWKFRPGKKGGRPVFVHLQVPVVFSLSGD